MSTSAISDPACPAASASTAAPAASTVVVLQPMFFPWIGHLEQIRLADVFVHYDDVQLSPGGFGNRVQLKTAQGKQWLTAPIEHAGLRTIAETRLCEKRDWRTQHLRTLQQAFAKAPCRDDAVGLVEQVYRARHETLADLCIASVEALADYFALRTEFVRSSTLAIGGRATARVVAICQRFQAQRYVTGHGARNYLEHDRFTAADIDVRYMDYARTPYPQQHGPFDPHCTALDLVANCGRDGRWAIASGTRPWQQFVQTPPTP